MREESLAFLRSLVNVASPSSYEEEAAAIFRDYTKPFSHEVRTDIHGNVSASLVPDAECRIMLAGHIDEIGLIVHYISDDGQLHFKTIGDHDPAVLVGQRVWVHSGSRVPGVIGRKPVHLLTEEEKGKTVPMDALTIDIGVSSRAEAERLVDLGDVATYQAEFMPCQGDIAVARSFDNKMGAFVVAEALRLLSQEGGLQPGVGVIAVGTVQEEVGYRGAITAAYNSKAKVGVAVDVAHATDHPGSEPERYGRLSLGKGPVVARGANINPVVFTLLRDAASVEGIPIQVDVEGDCTGTDASAMQISRSGMATGLTGVPVRYMHSPCEMLSLSDVVQCARLLAAFCRMVKPDTDFTPRKRGA